MTAAEREPTVAAFASQLRLESAPERLDGAGDSYHVSGRAWRNGHGVPARYGRPKTSKCSRLVPRPPSIAVRPSTRLMVSMKSYFCYFEDVDLGFRLRLQGHRCLYVPFRHRPSCKLSPERIPQQFRRVPWRAQCRVDVFQEHAGPLLWLYLPQHLALNLAALLYYPWRGQGRAVLRAKLDAVRGLAGALQRRRLTQRTRRVDAWSLRRAMIGGITTPYVTRYVASVGNNYTKRDAAE